MRYRCLLAIILCFSLYASPLSASALTTVSCSGSQTAAPLGSPSIATASCVFTTTAVNNITGIFSPTQVVLTGPSNNQKAVFQNITGTNVSVQDNGNGNFTATGLHTSIIINANYAFTPTVSTLAGSYVGIVSVTWTAI